MKSRLAATAAVALTFAALLLQACSGKPVASAVPPGLSRELVDAYVQRESGIPAARVAPDVRTQLAARLQRLTAAAARAAPSDANRERGELARIEALVHAAAEEAGVYQAPGDAQLREAYEKFVATLPAAEYHAAHILVATENAANELVVKLQAHADFATLARSESGDDSRSRGGDLGWISLGKLPSVFTDAVVVLKPGQFTQVPVHTPYGWHVIKLLETRAAAAPPFEQVKAQLATNIIEERYERFLAEGSIAAPAR